MDPHKVNWIVGYVELQTEFPFDAMDVEEDLEGVLAYFGFHPRLDDDERQELRAELGVLASEAELAEIARLVADGDQRELEWVGRTVYPEAFIRRPRAKTVPVDEWLDGVGLQPVAASMGEQS